MNPEKHPAQPDSYREIKRKRYRERRFIEDYDSRYRSGLNAVSTLVETDWLVRRGAGLTLDCGAGTGRFSLPLAGRGLAVIALDSSTGMLAELRTRSLMPCAAGDIFSLPVRDGAIDTLVCMHVLFHLPDWREVLAGFSRVLRPGGRLLFEMRSGEHVALARRALRLISRYQAVTPVDPAGETFHATYHEVSSALAACGLSVEARLRYDLGHSYYLTPFAAVLDEACAKHAALRRTLAALERLTGMVLPASLAYRTLFCAVKK